MSDSVAQDQIKALTDRVRQLFLDRRNRIFIELTGSPTPVSGFPDTSLNPKPPMRAPSGDGRSIADAAYWLDHCAYLSGRMDDFDHETRRGYTIACKLLGLSWNDTQGAIGATRSCGVEKAAAVWAPYLSAPDARYIGLVYVARHERDSGVRKVGFTTNIDKRMKALSRTEGRRVVVVSAVPGTMLNEWALHMDLGAPVKSEWYPTTAIPAWLAAPSAETEAA